MANSCFAAFLSSIRCCLRLIQQSFPLLDGIGFDDWAHLEAHSTVSMVCDEFWYQNFEIHNFGTKFLYKKLVPKFGTKIWHHNLISKVGTKCWHQGLVFQRVYPRNTASFCRRPLAPTQAEYQRQLTMRQPRSSTLTACNSKAPVGTVVPFSCVLCVCV